MSSFELRLPKMVMSVNEPRRDDLLIAINDLRPFRGLDFRSYFGNFVALD